MSVFNINIALLGTVSSGKSTLLNSLFLNEFSTMNITRSTMVPQIYRETLNNKHKVIKDAKQINKEASDINSFIKNNENEPNFDIKQYIEPKEFYVHKMKELNICEKDIYMSFYDIPGLNDCKNSIEYNNYVKNNFDDFDVILYLIDLNTNTGFSTCDEMSLLNLVLEYSSNHNKFVIPIINKSDDMTMVNNSLICNSKYKDNYKNIIDILEKEQLKYNNSKIQKPILYSAHESFMYRQLLKNPDFELTEKMEEYIGTSDLGKKFYKLSTEERTNKVKEIVKNVEFINEMITMSGYSNLYENLANILNLTNQQEMCVNKLVSKFNKLQTDNNVNIDNIFNIYDQFNLIYDDSLKLQNIFKINNILDEHKFINEIYDKLIGSVDFEKYNNLINFKKCLNDFQNHKYYKFVEDKIMFMHEHIKEYIYDYFDVKYNIKYSIDDLLEILEKLKINEVDKLNEYSDRYLNFMIANHTNFYEQTDFSNFRNVIEFDEKIQIDICKLKKYINQENIKKIYNFIVKNKIDNLISNINEQQNISECITILYNLLLFYNLHSNKNIEYSEIYTLLLSNYIMIINKNSSSNINWNFNKIDELLHIDNEYINV